MDEQFQCDDPQENLDPVGFCARMSMRLQKQKADELEPQPIDYMCAMTETHHIHGSPKGDHHKWKKHEQNGSEYGHHIQSWSWHHYQSADVNNYGRSWQTNDIRQRQLITIETKV